MLGGVKTKTMIKLKKHDKFENGEKVGELYAAVVITDRDGNVNVIDASTEDWRDYADCATLAIDEIEIPI